MSPGQLQGCSRGIYGLGSWDLPRQPKPETLQQLGVVLSKHHSTAPGSSSREKFVHFQLPAAVKHLSMMAKYTYTANETSPLGHELSVTRGDSLYFLKALEDNDSWWLAENSNGDVGYVPASYMLMQDKSRDLPLFSHQETKQVKGAKGFGVS